MTDIQKLRRLIRNAERRKRPMDAKERGALSAVKDQLAAIEAAEEDRFSQARGRSHAYAGF